MNWMKYDVSLELSDLRFIGQSSRISSISSSIYYGAFTLEVKSVLNENLGGILGGTQC
jgi:hypothetical protein